MTTDPFGWEKLAKATADAMSLTVVVGVRPHDRGWFASCDGEEADGGSARQAVIGLMGMLRQREQRTATAASSNARNAQGRLEALIAAVYDKEGDE